jgi:hypothetical protein
MIRTILAAVFAAALIGAPLASGVAWAQGGKITKENPPKGCSPVTTPCE